MKAGKMAKRLLSFVLSAAVAISAGTVAFAEGETVNNGTIEQITGAGTINGDNITVESAELDWYKADNTVGRNQDGWWVGVKIIAPASVTEDNVGKVNYSNNGTDNLDKNFGKNNDGTTVDGRYYMGCWLPVTPEYLESFLKADKNLVWTYRFDWDDDDKVDQTFTVTVDPKNITLKKDGSVFCQTENGVIVIKGGKHNHNYGTEWESNETNHWHACGCGDKKDEASHTYNWTVTKAPTYTENGYKTGICSVCGKEIVEEIPMLTYTPVYPVYPDYDYDTGSVTVTKKDGWNKSGKAWYYYEDGEKEKGWLKLKNTWYYLDPKTGAMYDDGLAEIDGETYYFYSWGGMANSFWYLDEETGDWYFFRGNGAMAKNAWIEWKGEYYYVGRDGAMLTNTVTPDGYTVDRNGVWVK